VNGQRGGRPSGLESRPEGLCILETTTSRQRSNKVEAAMPVTVSGTYATYDLSLWRWVSSSLISTDVHVRDRIDAELGSVLEEAGLFRSPAGVAPDLLLRYEAAPGVLVAELIDTRTNEKVWRTDLRGNKGLADGEALSKFGPVWRV